MTTFLLLCAAVCFAAGGVLMKLSNGLTRIRPTIGFLLLFGIGAVCQARAMSGENLAAIYVAVLGLEAVLVAIFSIVLFHERLSWQRWAAMLLVIAGVILLRRS